MWWSFFEDNGRNSYCSFSSCMSESDQHIYILNKRAVRVHAVRVAQEVGSPALRCENARGRRGGDF